MLGEAPEIPTDLYERSYLLQINGRIEFTSLCIGMNSLRQNPSRLNPFKRKQLPNSSNHYRPDGRKLTGSLSWG